MVLPSEGNEARQDGNVRSLSTLIVLVKVANQSLGEPLEGSGVPP